MTNHSATSQVASLVAASETVNASRTSQVAMLVAVDDTVFAPSTRISQLPVLVAVAQSADPGPRTAQVAWLVAYNEGQRENNQLRAWGFVLDGHCFYVLHLGEFGTWVCDVTSGNQWSQWQTQGMDNWNAEQGLMWYDQIIAGDNQNATLWVIDPELENDDDGFKPIARVATVNVPARGRKGMTLDMFSINAAAGYPSATGATMSLRFSDDNGETWFEAGSITFEAGSFDQNLQFGSLGYFGQPGRIIEVSDTGATMRLSDVDAEFSASNPWSAD